MKQALNIMKKNRPTEEEKLEQLRKLNEKFFEYRSSKLMDPEFPFPESLGCPILNKSELQFLKDHIPLDLNNAMALMPWNAILDNQNLTALFLENWKAPESYDIYPQVNIINLDSRKDRYQTLFRYLQLPNLSVFRFPAISNRPRGWMGCALSHIALLKYSRERYLQGHQEDSITIILEDDEMSLCGSLFESRVCQIIDTLKQRTDWDVFNGHALGATTHYHNIFDRKVGLVESQGLNTSCMIYSHKIYDKLIAMEPYYLDNKFEHSEKVLAWDELLKTHTKMITSFPYLSNTYSYDSNIAGASSQAVVIGNQPERNYWAMDSIYKKYDNMFSLGYNCFSSTSDVVVAITSARRYNELFVSLMSFFKYNTYHIRSPIIISEEGNIKTLERRLRANSHLEILFQKGHIQIIQGKQNQFKSLDNIFDKIAELKLNDAKFIFKMEDDWEIQRPFFIEISKYIMNRDPQVVSVWLRSLLDTNRHLADGRLGSKGLMKIGDVHCFQLDRHYNSDWSGFTLNTSLMNLAFFSNDFFQKHEKESKKNEKFKDKIPEQYLAVKLRDWDRFEGEDKRGYYGVIPAGMPFMRHIGYNSTISVNSDLIGINEIFDQD